MKTFKFKAYWQMTNPVEVQAKTLEEAVEILAEKALPLKGAEYVEGSLSLEDESGKIYQ